MEAEHFGQWSSEISQELVVESVKSFPHITTGPEGLYWIERRSYEQGRSSIVHLSHSKTAILELLFKPYSARTLLYEYGGRSLFVSGTTVYFTNYEDQNIYRIVEKSKPELLFADETMRFGEIIVDLSGKWLYCVCEKLQDQKEARHFIAKIDLETRQLSTLVEGNDFYASLSQSRDGNFLAFISWNHPSMNWDHSFLGMHDLRLNKTTFFDHKSSILQPLFSPRGDLFFLSDQSGFWNIYSFKQGSSFKEKPLSICPMAADCDQALWQLGIPTMTFVPNLDGEGSLHLALIYTEKAIDKLALIDLSSGELQEMHLPYTSMKDLHFLEESLYFIGGSPTDLPAIIELNLLSLEQTKLAISRVIELPTTLFSQPDPIEIETENGKIYAIYYPPQNPAVTPYPDEKPPLIVRPHSGPTHHARCLLNPEIQFWTSRGYAYVDVNYRGSTGFGRDYRKALNGHWGQVDAEDTIAVTEWFIDKELVNPEQIFLKGSSAGGFTALHAMQRSSLFKGAILYYPVTDLVAMNQETHKFEKYYTDSLIGPYATSEKLYEQLSPIHFSTMPSVEILLFQGADDKIIPHHQTEAFYKKLLSMGIKTSYHLFENEGHGFRSSETLSRCLELEESFYTRLIAIPVEKRT